MTPVLFNLVKNEPRILVGVEVRSMSLPAVELNDDLAGSVVVDFFKFTDVA